MTNTPLSIIIPTYNVEEHIARALDSLIKQTHTNFEIIIIDDCGSDSSIDIANDYAQRDSRIKIIANPKNLGTYHARRRGVEHASGEYIVFLDPDDELATETLQQIQLNAQKEETDIIFFGVMSPIKNKWYAKSPYIFPANKTQSLLVSYFSNGTRSYLWGTPGKAYKTNFIKTLYSTLNVSVDFRFVYAEDVFLLVHAMLLRPSYSCVYYDGYIYHNNETSITHSNLSEDDAKFLQYDFMVDSVIKHASKVKLSQQEERVFTFLTRKLYADRFLLLRHYGSSSDYLKYLTMSFKVLPNVAKTLKIAAFILSFGQIKL